MINLELGHGGIDVLIWSTTNHSLEIDSLSAMSCLPPQFHSLATRSWLLSYRNLVPLGEQGLNDRLVQ